MDNRFLLITFDSTHKAIRTDKMLKGVIGGELIPTPREISASCGLSFKFPEDSFQDIYHILMEKEGLLEGLALYLMERLEDKKQATRLEWK